MISLKCEGCLGTMEVDENREIISCPYCGSKKMIPMSDSVRIEKIRSEKSAKTINAISNGITSVMDKSMEIQERNMELTKKYLPMYFAIIILMIGLIIFMLSLL